MGILSSGAFGAEEIESRQQALENHGKPLRFNAEQRSAMIIPLQSLRAEDMPEAIRDLQKTNYEQYEIERLKHCAVSLNLLSFWLNDSEKIKAHNAAEDKKREADETYERFRIFNNYVFRVNFTRESAADFALIDPMAWFFANKEELMPKMEYKISSTGLPAIKNRVFLVVLDKNGSERIVEMSYGQFKKMTTQAASLIKLTKKPFTQVAWTLTNVIGAVSTDSNYILDAEMDIDFEELPFDIPFGTTLDLENHYAYGIDTENIALRRQILVALGLEDYFPADAKWLATEE